MRISFFWQIGRHKFLQLCLCLCCNHLLCLLQSFTRANTFVVNVVLYLHFNSGQKMTRYDFIWSVSHLAWDRFQRYPEDSCQGPTSYTWLIVISGPCFDKHWEVVRITFKLLNIFLFMRNEFYHEKVLLSIERLGLWRSLLRFEFQTSSVAEWAPRALHLHTRPIRDENWWRLSLWWFTCWMWVWCMMVTDWRCSCWTVVTALFLQGSI